MSQINTKHVAHLSRIELTDPEEIEFSKEIGEILNYVDELSKVSTENVQPISQICNLKNVYREDEVKEGLARDLVLKNSPQSQSGFIVVKKVFEN